MIILNVTCCSGPFKSLMRKKKNDTSLSGKTFFIWLGVFYSNSEVTKSNYHHSGYL